MRNARARARCAEVNAASSGMRAPRLLEKRPVLYLATLVVSVALSIYAIRSDPIIDDDGILYLETAQAFIDTDARAAFALYNWPFYSWLISLVQRTTSLGLETSGHVLNSFFLALLALVFVSFVKEVGGTRGVLTVAAIVFLVHPKIYGYRSFLTRDAGYWLFYLAAVLLFLRFFRQPTWKFAVAWVTSISIATLFRIEGAVVLLLLPLALLIKPECERRARWAMLGRAYTPHLVLALILGAMYWFSEWRETGRLFEPMDIKRLSKLGMLFDAKARALSGAILNKYSNDYAYAGVLATLAVILTATVIKGLTLPYCVLALHGGISRAFTVDRGTLTVLAWSAVLNLVTLAVFLADNFYLTGRVIIPLTLILMLAVPFSVAALYQNWRDRRMRWAFPAACAALFYLAADSLIATGPTKTFVRDAGLWLKANAGSDALVYTNQQKLVYYSNQRRLLDHEVTWEETMQFVNSGSWKNYDYLAVSVSRKEPEQAQWLEEKLGLPPVARFVNNRNDQVVIFKLR